MCLHLCTYLSAFVVHLSVLVVRLSVLVVYLCGSKSSLFVDFLPRPTHPPSTLPPCSTFLMIIIIEHIIMVKMSIYVQAKFQHHDHRGITQFWCKANVDLWLGIGIGIEAYCKYFMWVRSITWIHLFVCYVSCIDVAIWSDSYHTVALSWVKAEKMGAWPLVGHEYVWSRQGTRLTSKGKWVGETDHSNEEIKLCIDLARCNDVTMMQCPRSGVVISGEQSWAMLFSNGNLIPLQWY